MLTDEFAGGLFYYRVYFFFWRLGKGTTAILAHDTRGHLDGRLEGLDLVLVKNIGPIIILGCYPRAFSLNYQPLNNFIIRLLKFFKNTEH